MGNAYNFFRALHSCSLLQAGRGYGLSGLCVVLVFSRLEQQGLWYDSSGFVVQAVGEFEGF